jgi:hypothetical protein
MATETYELQIQGVQQQERNVVVMHFESDNVTANETFSNGTSLITSWVTNVMTDFLLALPNSYWLDRITARRAHPKPSAVAHRQFDNNTVAGGIAGTVVGDQTCPSIFLVPPMGTKSGGRIFMPCVDVTSVIGNQYQAGYVSAINTFMADQTTNFGVSGIHWQQVVYSRKNNTSAHVLSWVLSNRIGYQKRRRSPV